KSDIYSMGVTFFQLLTGFLPIEDKDSEKMLEKVVDQAPVPLHAYRYDLHPELEELVMSMLQKKHEMRPTAREVFERLRRMKEAWEKDPMINQALEIKEGPGTHQMKLMMERRRWELEERANKDTVTHAGS